MPGRILKENIRTSNKINAISDFSFRLWAYLLTYVDDYGCSSADVDIIKGFCFSKMKDKTCKNISDALKELESVGLIQLYAVDGEPFLHFPNWESFQTVRATKRKFPEPPPFCKQLQAIANNCKQMQADVSVIDTRNRNRNSYSHTPRACAESVRHDEILSLFAEICQNLPSASLTDKRIKAIEAVADSVDAFGGWEKLFRTVSQSDFLMGRNGGWKASFDWIVKPDNLQKIIEGNYTNRTEQRQASYDLTEFERRSMTEPIRYERREK